MRLGLALFTSTIVVASACMPESPPKRELGEPCHNSYHCRDKQTPERRCYNQRCVTKERFAIESEKASRIQSGLAPEAEAEAEPVPPETPPVPAGFNVRIQRAKGSGEIYAACQPDEFLIGGGCSSVKAGSKPIEKQPGTTRGGRWLCTQDGVLLEAHAFCMRR